MCARAERMCRTPRPPLTHAGGVAYHSHNGETGHGDRRPRLEPWLIMPLRQWRVCDAVGGVHHSLIIATQRTAPIRKLFERDRVKDAAEGREGFQVPDDLSSDGGSVAAGGGGEEEKGAGGEEGKGEATGESKGDVAADDDDGQAAGEGSAETKGDAAGEGGGAGGADGKALDDGDDGASTSQAGPAASARGSVASVTSGAGAGPELQPLFPPRAAATRCVVTAQA